MVKVHCLYFLTLKDKQLAQKKFEKQRDGLTHPLHLEKLKLNEYLKQQIILIIEAAHKAAQKIREKSSTYGEKYEGGIDSLVTSLIMKWSYYDDQSIIFFMAELFFDIATKHYFYNGNKRTSILTLFYLSRMLGYYFSWSKMYGSETGVALYEWLVCEVVKRNENGILKQSIINFIVESIKPELLVYWGVAYV